MRGDEFLDKMELVDADLVEAAGRQLSSTAGSNYRKGGAYMARKIAALAAVIALMICSGAVGAIAFSSETIVEVPAEQESIELEAIGLTLILPDSWEGKYGVEMDADGAGCAVYALFPHESANGWGSRGYLFWVGLAYDEPLTPQQLEEHSDREKDHWDLARLRALPMDPARYLRVQPAVSQMQISYIAE